MSKKTLTLDHIKNPLEAIELAIADATIVFKKKGYVKDMTNWHKPGFRVYAAAADICYVCMTGAIIVNSLESKLGDNTTPTRYAHVGKSSLTSICKAYNTYSRTEGVLKSIDSIRCGDYSYIEHYTVDHECWATCIHRALAKTNLALLKEGNLRTWKALARHVRTNADEMGLI